MDKVPPGYWKTLLELSTSVADTAEHPENSTPSTSGVTAPVDQNNQAWLEEVMADLVKKTDPSKQLSICLDTLETFQKIQNVTDEVVDRIEEVANALIDLLSFADLTRQFADEKGFELVTHFMKPSYPEKVQILFGDAILTLADNNPLAQEAISNFGLLEAVMEAVLETSRDKAVRLKLLGIICASVGSHPPSYQRFLDFGGKEMLTTLYKDEDIDVALKAARITCTIAFTYSDNKELVDSIYDQICDGYITSLTRAPDKGINEIKYMNSFLRSANMKAYEFPEIIRESVEADKDIEKDENTEDQDEEVCNVSSALEAL
ncbi:unnamed protein product [Auanema sp. JU1783]|nr:unnamed protein product [Auanema sp. JU1783]